MRYRPLACSGSEGVPVWLWECSVWVLVRHRCLSFGALLSKCSLVCLFVHHRFFSACKDGKVVSPECFVRPQLEASNCAVGMYVFQFRLVLTQSTSSPGMANLEFKYRCPLMTMLKSRKVHPVLKFQFVATFRVAKLTLQLRTLWLAGVVTDRGAHHACLCFFSLCVFLFFLLAFHFYFSCFFFCFASTKYKAKKSGKIKNKKSKPQKKTHTQKKRRKKSITQIFFRKFRKNKKRKHENIKSNFFLKEKGRRHGEAQAVPLSPSWREVRSQKPDSRGVEEMSAKDHNTKRRLEVGQRNHDAPIERGKLEKEPLVGQKVGTRVTFDLPECKEPFKKNQKLKRNAFLTGKNEKKTK